MSPAKRAKVDHSEQNYALLALAEAAASVSNEEEPTQPLDSSGDEGEHDNEHKGSWTKEEDEMLRQMVTKLGTSNWSAVAVGVKGRAGKSCRLRWFNQLDPRVVKKPFSEEEDAIITEAHKKYGNSWSAIARLLTGRTDNAVKNRWNATLRRRVQLARKRRVTSCTALSPEVAAPPPPPLPLQRLIDSSANAVAAAPLSDFPTIADMEKGLAARIYSGVVVCDNTLSCAAINAVAAPAAASMPDDAVANSDAENDGRQFGANLAQAAPAPQGAPVAARPVDSQSEAFSPHSHQSVAEQDTCIALPSQEVRGGPDNAGALGAGVQSSSAQSECSQPQQLLFNPAQTALTQFQAMIPPATAAASLGALLAAAAPPVPSSAGAAAGAIAAGVATPVAASTQALPAAPVSQLPLGHLTPDLRAYAQYALMHYMLSCGGYSGLARMCAHESIKTVLPSNEEGVADLGLSASAQSA